MFEDGKHDEAGKQGNLAGGLFRGELVTWNTFLLLHIMKTCENNRLRIKSLEDVLHPSELRLAFSSTTCVFEQTCK
jgi:hypothetical protein